MKLNLLKISSLFFILLVIGIIIFTIAPDFAVAAPFIDTIVKIGEIIAEIDERVSPTFRLFFYVTTFLLVLLQVSLFVLNWAAGIGMYIGPDSLGYIFYDIGYAWVLGMVNMFFVIALVFAALLYMLDVEWGIVDKKTIPRLLIIALLINFSSLFVKIIVDFFIIFERGVMVQLMPGGLTPILVSIGIQAVVNWIFWGFFPYIALLIMEVIAGIIGLPLVGVPALLLTIQQLITLPVLLIPLSMELISNAFLFFIFSFYAILFIARSIFIYFFVMVAPLAIAATVFPQTRKYFDEWLKQLILWGVMGTIIFFVLGFGFHMRGVIADGFNIQLAEVILGGIGIGIGVVGGMMIFLANVIFAIYALVSLFMIKRFLPSAVQGGISMLQQGAMMATMAVGGMVGANVLMKYGGGVQNKLSKVSKKLGGEKSWAGSLVADVSHSVGSQVDKVKAEKVRKVARLSKPEQEEYVKHCMKNNDLIGADIGLQALPKDLQQKDLEKMGIKDGNELIKIVGEERAEKDYSHFRKARDLKKNVEEIKNSEKKIKEIKENAKKEGREELNDTERNSIATEEEKIRGEETKINDRFSKSTPTQMKEIIEAETGLDNEEKLREAIISTNDKQKISYFYGNNEDKINAAFVDLTRNYNFTTTNKANEAFIKKYRALFELVGEFSKSKINASNVINYCGDDMEKDKIPAFMAEINQEIKRCEGIQESQKVAAEAKEAKTGTSEDQYCNNLITEIEGLKTQMKEKEKSNLTEDVDKIKEEIKEKEEELSVARGLIWRDMKKRTIEGIKTRIDTGFQKIADTTVDIVKGKPIGDTVEKIKEGGEKIKTGMEGVEEWRKSIIVDSNREENILRDIKDYVGKIGEKNKEEIENILGDLQSAKNQLRTAETLDESISVKAGKIVDARKKIREAREDAKNKVKELINEIDEIRKQEEENKRNQQNQQKGHFPSDANP